MSNEEQYIKEFKEKDRLMILPTLDKHLIVEIYDNHDELKGRIVFKNKAELLNAIELSIEEENSIDIDPGEN